MTELVQNVTDTTFEAQVLTSPDPVLVDFAAKWCTPCRMIEPLVVESAKTYEGRLKVVRLDVDENPAAASRYHIRSIPALLLFKNGAPAATHVGALGQRQLAEFVEPHLRDPSPAQATYSATANGRGP